MVCRSMRHWELEISVLFLVSTSSISKVPISPRPHWIFCFTPRRYRESGDQVSPDIPMARRRSRVWASSNTVSSKLGSTIANHLPSGDHDPSSVSTPSGFTIPVISSIKSKWWLRRAVACLPSADKLRPQRCVEGSKGVHGVSSAIFLRTPERMLSSKMPHGTPGRAPAKTMLCSFAETAKVSKASPIEPSIWLARVGLNSILNRPGFLSFGRLPSTPNSALPSGL
jgi:hypothetical protein